LMFKTNRTAGSCPRYTALPWKVRLRTRRRVDVW
jgi:hypothetical protein